jgi:hypothetical protein
MRGRIHGEQTYPALSKRPAGIYYLWLIGVNRVVSKKTKQRDVCHLAAIALQG